MNWQELLLTGLGYLSLGLGLGYWGAPLWVGLLYGAILLFWLSSPPWLWGLYGGLALVLKVPWLRQRLITAPLVAVIQAAQVLPAISATERAAIEAGTVGLEGEFFTGRPNWSRLMAAPYPEVPPEVQAFLDGPVEQVCRMATDWEIYERRDLSPEVWDYLKQEGFFGMMIPTEYGGLGFSHLAYSTVMAKLASRSFTHVATVGVPNSLGPAKLLLRYGTPEQKTCYLPRLARGEEIPCFALTEPEAGSDAANLTARGEVFQGTDGQLYLRLNWRKRYITLGAIATLLGLAFRLYDPEHLLGEVEDIGITCALIPTHTPGVIIDQRHDPMGVPFYNSPTEGHDVVVPLEQIIGGVAQAGQGWKMLMQTLAAGRGVSFPASCAGVAKLVSRVTGAYALVRQQFGLPIGRFEGVAEPLARIGGYTYLLDALRLYTVGAVDQGEQPAVVAAIAKYQSTELTRQIVLDGMDILGGAGICRGPRNLLANLYTAMPIAITVEGANILTRTLMIFGQGAIRSHPYIYAEITALEQRDLVAFDRAFWPHLGSILRHGCRTLLLSLTRGRLAMAPVPGAIAPYGRKLTWAAATFALCTDLALLTLGGSLKRREALTGRFADWLSWLYLGTAILRRYEAEGRRPEDLPFVHWGMQSALTQMQTAFEGILANLPGSRWLTPWRWAVRLNPWGTPPADVLGQTVAQMLQTPGERRDRITQGIYLPTDPAEALGRLEQAFERSIQAEAILSRIKQASRSGRLPQKPPTRLIDTAVTTQTISDQEYQQLLAAMAARLDAIQVDTFAAGRLSPTAVQPAANLTQQATDTVSL